MNTAELVKEATDATKLNHINSQLEFAILKFRNEISGITINEQYGHTLDFKDGSVASFRGGAQPYVLTQNCRANPRRGY